MSLANHIKNIAVIGLGMSGKAAAQFLLDRGYAVWGCDRHAESVQSLVEKGLRLFEEADPLPPELDLVVVSPGISPQHKHYQAAKAGHVEIIGEIELACRYLDHVFLGITGTNGKTTVTLLTAHILNRCGKKAYALGNVGTPLISQVETLSSVVPKPIIVAELSSYQLETFKCPIMDAGVILNITPDHLDRYPHMASYASAKIQMQCNLKPGKPLFILNDVWESYQELFDNHQPWTYGYASSCHYQITHDALICRGQIEWLLPEKYQCHRTHDLENIVASYALCKEMGVSPSEFLEALSAFTKPAHRIEFVRTYNQIDFYNDSKGTNLDAVIRAVESIHKPIVLIAGGVDKGASYTAWLPVFHGKVKGICSIGQASDKIQKELADFFPVIPCPDLATAIHSAMQMASSGEAVLLSPGCASQDMFKDYAHRGDVFKAIVNAL